MTDLKALREKVLSDALSLGCPWCAAGASGEQQHYPDCDLLRALSEPRAVWAIEQGEYSDYHVVGVFTSAVDAELVVDTIGGDSTIAEWPLNPAVADIRAGRKPFWVLMLRDGTVESVRPTEPNDHELAGRAWIHRRSSAPAFQGTGLPDALQVTAWATDEQHAVKIANEKRLQMIASGEWR